MKPLRIGNHVAVSSPSMHAHILEKLLPPIQSASNTGRDPSVLLVVCGSGYLLGAFARLLWCNVTGIEPRQEMFRNSVENIQRDMTHSDESDLSNRIHLHHAIGSFGWPECSTRKLYDAIHVAAAMVDAPKALLDQLKPGGRLIIPGNA